MFDPKPLICIKSVYGAARLLFFSRVPSPFFQKGPGIFIMQNTMVRGRGGNDQLGEKMKERKEKRRKITLKKGEKALKMHLFGL